MLSAGRSQWPPSVDERAVVACGQRNRPGEQAKMVVGPELDRGQPETVDVHELPGPRPAMGGPSDSGNAPDPGVFFPWVVAQRVALAECGRFLILVNEEGIEASCRTRRPLQRQVDEAQKLAGCPDRSPLRPQQLRMLSTNVAARLETEYRGSPRIRFSNFSLKIPNLFGARNGF